MQTKFTILLTTILAVIAVFSSDAPAEGRVNDQTGFKEKEVVFGSKFKISGTIISPVREGKHPAIIFLHGSAPLTRKGPRAYAIDYAKLGFVSLVFDRRGAGKSEGDRFATSLSDMAEDALSGIRFLKKQKNVDPKRVGIWAISQGGWVATSAAASSNEVAFMIIVSGGGADPKESEIFSYLGNFRRAGLPPNEIADGLKTINKFFDYLETGNGLEELRKLVEESKERPWYQYAKIGNIIPSSEKRLNWKWVASFRSELLIETIKCPVLLMFGERDKDHPTDLAVRKWRQGLSRGGNTDISIMVFPGAGHGIRMRDDFNGKGRAPFADGYFEVMSGWLWEHVLKPVMVVGSW